MVIYMNTSISKPKVTWPTLRAWAAPLYYMELYLQYFVKMQYQHHSSVVNGKDINRDINLHRPGRYLRSLCLHSTKTSAWKGKNWVKCSGSLSAQYKSSSWKVTIYPSPSSVYHCIRKHMDERKGLFFCVTIHDTVCVNYHLPRSTVSSHTTYTPFIYAQRLVVVAEGKAR